MPASAPPHLAMAEAQVVWGSPPRAPTGAGCINRGCMQCPVSTDDPGAPHGDPDVQPHGGRVLSDEERQAQANKAARAVGVTFSVRPAPIASSPYGCRPPSRKWKPGMRTRDGRPIPNPQQALRSLQRLEALWRQPRKLRTRTFVIRPPRGPRGHAPRRGCNARTPGGRRGASTSSRAGPSPGADPEPPPPEIGGQGLGPRQVGAT